MLESPASLPQARLLGRLRTTDATMYLRRTIHRNAPLLAKDVQVHRMEYIPKPSIQTYESNQGTLPTGRWLLASLADRFTGIEFDFPLLLRLEECLDCFHRFVCWAWVRAAFDGPEHLWQAAARYD
ncbi:MAG: hypothetical protein ACKO3V_10525, partial [Pirellula sp.]